MNDSELDRVLRSTFDVEPPPGLVPRVRAAVETTSPWAPWRPGIAMAAVAVMCVLAWAALRPQRVEPEQVAADAAPIAPTAAPTSSSTAMPTSGPTPTPTRVPEPASTAPSAAPPARRLVATTGETRRERVLSPVFDKIQIAAEDRLGFEALVAAVEAGTLPVVLDDADREGQFARVAELEPLEPIAIAALPPIPSLEFEELN